MKPKAVIFDLDDTLLKTWVIKWAHHKAVAKQFYDIDLTDEVLAEHWGKPFEAMMAQLYQNADTAEGRLKANHALADKYLKESQADSLAAVTYLLGQGVEVGVVTSIHGHMARQDLLRLGFPADQFFILQGSDEVEAHKPDPGVFSQTLELLAAKSIKPSEAVYVGDALIDYHAARDAGLGFMGVTTGFATQEQFDAEGAPAAETLIDALRVMGFEEI